MGNVQWPITPGGGVSNNHIRDCGTAVEHLTFPNRGLQNSPRWRGSLEPRLTSNPRIRNDVQHAQPAVLRLLCEWPRGITCSIDVRSMFPWPCWHFSSSRSLCSRRAARTTFIHRLVTGVPQGTAAGVSAPCSSSAVIGFQFVRPRYHPNNAPTMGEPTKASTSNKSQQRPCVESS